MTKNFVADHSKNTPIASEAERKAYVRDWIARRVSGKGLAGSGLMGAVLTLPMLARAQEAEAVNNASEIEGVQSVEVMPDGSVELTMENGATVVAPESQVSITEAGDVLVTDRVVDTVAEVMAAGGGGAGIGTPGIAAGALGAIGAAAAASGGGSDGPPVFNQSDVLSAESTGLDLPEDTATATVTLENEDGDSVTRDLTLDEDGEWELPLDDGSGDELPQGRVTVTVTSYDEDGEELEEDSTDVIIDTVPPTIEITEIDTGDDDVLNAAEQDEAMTVTGTTDAEDGQQVTVTVNGEEYTAQVSDGEWSVDVPAADLADLSDGEEVEVTADVEDAAGNPATTATASFETDFTAPSLAIDTPIAGDDVLNVGEQENGITVTGTTDAEDGQEVTVTVNGAESAAAASGGVWSVDVPAADLADLPDGEEVEITADVEDANGNPATATASFETDFSAPSITIDTPVAGDDNVLDLQELDADSGLLVTGSTNTAEGSDVTVTLGEDAASNSPVKVQADGTFSILIPEAELADGEEYELQATVEGTSGNVTTSDPVSFTTDFRPVVAIDELGADGAVNLADIEDPEISGTTYGIEDGQDVTVDVTDADGSILSGTATVGGDGTWTLPVDQATIDELEAGQNYTVTANASNAAGVAAAEASESFDAYLGSVFSHLNTETNDSTLTVAAIGNEDFDSNDGVETVMTFDPSMVTYVEGSADYDLDLSITNEDDADSGTVVFSGGTAADSLEPGSEVFTFDMEDQDSGPITLAFSDEVSVDGDPRGGSSELQIGTAAGDTLTAGAIDSVLHGKGGDDTLDVSATGVNRVVFEVEPDDNGTDTVTGFSTGTEFQDDQIGFAGTVDLRGDGSDVEALGSGGTLGADTGFVVFTTELGGLGQGAFANAAENLEGEAAGDEIYMMASDGSDAALARVSFSGEDAATAEVMANFDGLGDLSQLDTANVLLPDSTGTVT